MFGKLRSLSGIAIAAILLLIFGAGAAAGAALITGADIQDNTVASVDLKDNSAKSATSRTTV